MGAVACSQTHTVCIWGPAPAMDVKSLHCRDFSHFMASGTRQSLEQEVREAKKKAKPELKFKPFHVLSKAKPFTWSSTLIIDVTI